MSPFLFACAALALLAMPGPTNLLLVAAGERGGVGRGLVLLPLVGLAYACGIALVAGAVALFPALALAAWFKAAAAAWLMVLAARIWRRPELAHAQAGGPAALFATTLTNPKVVVFATLLIPPAPLVPRLAVLMPLVGVAGAFYLLLGAGLVRLALPQRVVWRALAALLMGFAGLAALR